MAADTQPASQPAATEAARTVLPPKPGEELKVRVDALMASSDAARTTAEAKPLLASADSMFEEAISVDDYSSATKLAELETTVGARTKDAEWIRSAHSRTAEVKAISVAFDAAENARRTLSSTPDDPEANLVAGRFECLMKRDWTKGLPLLLRGSDEGLKALARAELEPPEETESQIALADGWWDRAAKETGVAHDNLLEHAGAWYRAALPNASGLAKLKIEEQLSRLPKGARPPSQAGGADAGVIAAADKSKVACKFLYLCADDFVVEVYVNGKPVGDEKRKLIHERFGATVERIEVELHPSDWIVFNVVNDRLRWNGSKYFAAAGMMEEGKPAFWTEATSGNWSFCEAPANADQFISQREHLAGQHVELIRTQKWGLGDGIIQNLTKNWRGQAIWSTGPARSIWIKYVVGSAVAEPTTLPAPASTRPGPTTRAIHYAE